ncbi:GNAT family N-acetyltransferase [Flavobacterium sp. GT3R68]|uniref:GNAT family N-acetyltransferase n=1 Tax=Flavobacterium sp. GT3R68 TaxID=2594437 RepID=UPI000F86B3A3|nr:GNAT family N-acetyltransferase [Flavobacterium sp. GT3R68]RTY90952.1 GNAT family N-acetyltransferase [Flavobacterium sp. GSN2]TRW90515.1 GNAT family N-acetyltransferase [Flavobacterium sp. GT3R68]
MIATASFKIFRSVSELPSHWDDLAACNIFLSRNYLKVLEVSSPENMTCHFIGLFHDEELVGLALSQYINLSDVSSFGERDHCLKTKIRTIVFKNFASNVLFIGNNMLTGQNAYCFSEKLPVSNGLVLLDKAVTELTHQLHRKGSKIHITVFKDFSSEQTKHYKVPEFDSYFQFTTQPNMIFQIPENWQSIDDYVGALSKKYRDQYKRARKKSEGLTKKKLSLEEITTHNDRISELYMDVAKNAPFNTFYLPENHFEAFKKSLGHDFLFYGYFEDDKLIGFNTLIKNGTDIDTYFLGYDENCQREKMLYLNMLYDMIGYSVKKGYKRIIFARTALEIKSSVGSKPIEMFGFIKHSNFLLNKFISKLFRYLEPEMVWQERSPFK